MTRSIAVEYGEYGIRANTININGMKGYTTKVNEITDIFSKMMKIMMIGNNLKKEYLWVEEAHLMNL